MAARAELPREILQGAFSVPYARWSWVEGF